MSYKRDDAGAIRDEDWVHAPRVCLGGGNGWGNPCRQQLGVSGGCNFVWKPNLSKVLIVLQDHKRSRPQPLVERPPPPPISLDCLPPSRPPSQPPNTLSCMVTCLPGRFMAHLEMARKHPFKGAIIDTSTAQSFLGCEQLASTAAGKAQRWQRMKDIASRILTLTLLHCKALAFCIITSLCRPCIAL